jgi:hypothetical protein
MCADENNDERRMGFEFCNEIHEKMRKCRVKSVLKQNQFRVLELSESMNKVQCTIFTRWPESFCLLSNHEQLFYT